MKPKFAMALAALLLGTSPFGSTAIAETASKPLTPVSVGILFMASDSAIFVAKERGYFAEQGIDVTLNRFASAADIIALMATNKLDVGSGGATPGLYNAFRQGMNVQIVASKAVMLDAASGTGSLLVRKDLVTGGRVKTVADLKGLRIAVNAIQSTSLNYVLRGLAVGGLKRDDVTLVELPFNQFIPAFEKKAIDAAMVYSPLSETISQKLNLASDLPAASASATSRGDTPNMLFYSPGFAASDNGRRFMIAYLRGSRDYYSAVNQGKSDHDEVCGIIHKYVETVPANCAGIRMSRVDPDGGVNLASLERYQSEWLAWDVMQKGADIPAHVNMQFVKDAIAKLGPYQQ